MHPRSGTALHPRCHANVSHIRLPQYVRVYCRKKPPVPVSYTHLQQQSDDTAGGKPFRYGVLPIVLQFRDNNICILAYGHDAVSYTHLETTSYWVDRPIDVAEFEEKLGVGAESQDYRIIEKVLPFADEVMYV